MPTTAELAREYTGPYQERVRRHGAAIQFVKDVLADLRREGYKVQLHTPGSTKGRLCWSTDISVHIVGKTVYPKACSVEIETPEEEEGPTVIKAGHKTVVNFPVRTRGQRASLRGKRFPGNSDFPEATYEFVEGDSPQFRQRLVKLVGKKYMEQAAAPTPGALDDVPEVYEEPKPVVPPQQTSWKRSGLLGLFGR